MKGQTIDPGMKIVDLEKGHTAVVAGTIQSAIGGDLFKMETVKSAELLMSDAGAFITGSTFLADGGATASYYYGPLQP